MYTGFLDAVSNREDVTVDFELRDDATGELVDLSGYTFNAAIRSDSDSLPIITASTADGRVAVPSTGVFTVSFSRADMSVLSAGTYSFGVTYTVDGRTEQLVAATLPVIDGVVAA